jgi:hypothetical protein
MRRYFILLAAVLLIGVAYVLGSQVIAASDTSPGNSAAEVAALAPTAGVSVEATPISATINLGSLGSPRVLAWNPNVPQLGWYASSGQPVGIMAATAKALIAPCGVLPSGDRMIIFIGGDTAQPFIFPLDNGAPVSLGANLGLVCSVAGRLQLSPDGNRLGLIKYVDGSVEAKFTVGTLRILKMPEATEQKAAEDVMSFDLQNDGAVYAQVYANTKGEANSIDLTFWDGSKDRKLEENIKPQEKCQFVAARILRSSDKVFTLLGEKCTPGGFKWRIMRTDLGGGNSTNLVNGLTGLKGAAAYLNNTGTNNMWLMPGGKELMFTVPNGLNSDVADLARVSVEGGAKSDILAGVEVDIYPPPRGRRFLFNPTGDHLALITRAGNQSEKLYMYDLTSPSTAPVFLAGGNAADRINGVAWSADGTRLYYVITGEDNVMSYATTKGETKRVIRGSFQGLAINPDGSVAATSEQRKAGTNDIRNDLVMVMVADQSKVTLVEGAKGEGPLVPIIVR